MSQSGVPQTAPHVAASPAAGVQPGISVVVPTYNRRQSLQRLLQALATQTLPPDSFEAVVVDDGSTDGTPDLLRRLAISLPYRLRVFQQGHGGPAQARNLGVERAQRRLIVFLDDDVVPAPDLLAAHVAAHAVERDAVVIGPMSPPRDVPRPAWIRWEEEQLEKQYKAMMAGQWACTARQFYTGNASLPREWFLQSGGFDVGFKRAEDVELAYRLADRGARFVFDPRASVLHYAARTFDAWCRTPYQYGRYDVVMERDKGQETLQWATHEFHFRHPLSRRLIRLCVGQWLLLTGTVVALRGLAAFTDRVGARRATSAALSAIFSLRYWQGVCDELGGPQPLWHLIAAAKG